MGVTRTLCLRVLDVCSLVDTSWVIVMGYVCVYARVGGSHIPLHISILVQGSDCFLSSIPFNDSK